MKLKNLISAYLLVNPTPHSLQIANLACAVGVTASEVIDTMAVMLSDLSSEDVLEDPSSVDVPTNDLVLNDGSTDSSEDDTMKEALLDDGLPEDDDTYESANELLLNDVPTPSVINAATKEELMNMIDPALDGLMHSITSLTKAKAALIETNRDLNKPVMKTLQIMKDAHTELVDLADTIQEMK